MSEYFKVADIFGEYVFNDTVMKERLPKKVYQKLQETIKEGTDLDLATADIIAHEMKEWAIEQGATHYTHWFQPLTGVTAEKHDSFITAPNEQGKVLMSFSGKELIKMGFFNFIHNGMEFFFFGHVYRIIQVFTENRSVGRDFNYVHSVDITELFFFGKCSTGHAGFLFIFIEEVLECDRCKCLALTFYLYMLFCLDCLMQAIRVASSPAPLPHHQPRGPGGL